MKTRGGWLIDEDDYTIVMMYEIDDEKMNEKMNVLVGSGINAMLTSLFHQ